MIKIIFLNNWGEPCNNLLQRYSKQTPNNKGIWKNLIGVTNIKDADFYYAGIKFATLDIVKKMKIKRGEDKDKRYVKLINKFIV